MQHLKKSLNPDDKELLEALEINLRVLKHADRNTYRGGQLDPALINSVAKSSTNLANSGGRSAKKSAESIATQPNLGASSKS